MHTLEDFYQLLSDHNIVKKVLYYSDVYPYQGDTYTTTSNPLCVLFAWGSTDEESDYWLNMYNSHPMTLELVSIGEIREYLRSRLDQGAPSYEYW